MCGIVGCVGFKKSHKYTNMGIMSYVNIAIAAVLLVLVIVHFVMLCKRRHGASILEFIVALIEVFGVFVFITYTFIPGYVAATGKSLYYFAGQGVNANSFLGFWGWIIGLMANNNINIVALLLFFLPALLFVIGFILALVALIGDIRYLASLPKPVKKAKKAKKQQDNEEPIDAEEAPEIEPAAAMAPAAMPQQQQHVEPVPAPAGMSGPFLIQYINTYGPTQPQPAQQPMAPVPAPQPQPEAPKPLTEEDVRRIMNEKPLSAEDVRKIISEEMGRKEEPLPLIVSVPTVDKPKKEEKPALSAEDVRAIFTEEIGRFLAQKEEPAPAPAPEPQPEPEPEVVVEEEPEPALSAEDIRKIIAEELAAAKPAEEEPKPEPENIRDVVREELASFQAAKDEAAKAKAEEEAAAKAREDEIAAAKAEAAEAALKEAEEKRQAEEQAKAEEEAKAAAEAPKPLTSEDIRAIIAEELAAAKPAEEKKDEAAITAEMIREIIRAELKEAQPVKEEKIVPVTVVVKEKEEVKPEPQPEPEPTPAPVIVPVIAEPEPEPEPQPEPEPEPEPQRAVGEVNPNRPPHEKIIRIPFPTRMVEGEKDLKSNYNELKSEIMSYGVKSRVSNSGDTFRLHKVTFVKITVAGKGLKLYFALDPKDYANTTLPVQDAGHKGTYRDIPLVFKVRSELSVRRAKQLISDVMEKNGIEQGKVEPHNWAEELKDYKPAGSDKDDD